MKKKRIFAAAMVLVLLLAIVLSACVTVLEATHDCTGADCTVCRLIQLICGVIRTFSYAAVVILLSFTAHLAPTRLPAAPTFARCATPVTEKVRLLN